VSIDHEQIVRTVIEAIARVKEIPADGITLDQKFEEIGMDSLDGLNVVFELEVALGIAIATDDAIAVRSVRDVVAAVEQLLNTRGTSAAV
jgi:acyl carrier protein